MNVKKNKSGFKVVTIGVSAGGLKALKTIFPLLPNDFELPVIVVQHRHSSSDSSLIVSLNENSKLVVKEADEKERINPGMIYIAPPNYHLLVENDKTFSLTSDEPVNYARPSIDVLFESASDVYGSKLIGIILTGANRDGSNGLKRIKERGGTAIVQDPQTAQSSAMPKSAIAITEVDYIVPLEQIGRLLVKLTHKKENNPDT